MRDISAIARLQAVYEAFLETWEGQLTELPPLTRIEMTEQLVAELFRVLCSGQYNDEQMRGVK